MVMNVRISLDEQNIGQLDELAKCGINAVFLSNQPKRIDQIVL